MKYTKTKLIVGLFAFLGYCLAASVGSAQYIGTHDIHPTAQIHPSVIMEGHVQVGAYTRINAGTVLTGDITIGHHTLLACNVVIRGKVKVGNYTHVYDNVCIEGGRPAGLWSTTTDEDDKAIIGNYCWVNHGATMHGTQMGDYSAVNLNAACDYNTRIGEGAILGNGSATNVGQVIPPNTLAVGVPAKVVKENITNEDRAQYFGVIPEVWASKIGEWVESWHKGEWVKDKYKKK